MNVKTIHMSDLFKRCDDICLAVMIVSKRAKQIIDERVIPIDENDDVEDSLEFIEDIAHSGEIIEAQRNDELLLKVIKWLENQQGEIPKEFSQYKQR